MKQERKRKKRKKTRDESSLDEVVQVDRSCSVLQVSVSKYIHKLTDGLKLL